MSRNCKLGLKALLAKALLISISCRSSYGKSFKGRAEKQPPPAQTPPPTEMFLQLQIPFKMFSLHSVVFFVSQSNVP